MKGLPIISKVASRLPFLAWVGELNDPKTLKADIFAGLTVALILIPQSMAYAQIVGIDAQYGLYASFIPVMLAALLGSSRQLSTGPVAIISLLTFASLQNFNLTPETYLIYVFALTTMVGLTQLIIGFARLGWVISFLSHPVIVGFTNAAALIIGFAQLYKIFGVAKPVANSTYQQVWEVILSIGQGVHFPTIAISILALSIILTLKKFFPKIPGILIAVIITTLVSWKTKYGVPVEQGGMGGSIIGYVPTGLPAIEVPHFDLKIVSDLLIASITISLVSFIEAISIAKAMAVKTRQKLSINTELVGQGVANVVSGFSHGCVVSGSLSRSAVNISAGAKTGFSSVVTAVVIGVTLLWFTPLLFHLPQVTLAIIIILAIVQLLRFAPIKHAWKVQKHDAVVAVVTFLLTLMTAPHLENGIAVGVILSLGFFLYRTMEPKFTELSNFDQNSMLTSSNDEDNNSTEVISIVKYSGSLYFASAGYFESKISRVIANKKSLKYIIIDMSSIDEIDASGEEILTNLVVSSSESGVELLFARVDNIMHVLKRSGFVKRFGVHRFFNKRIEALNFAWDDIKEKEKSEKLKEQVVLTQDTSNEVKN